MYNVLHVCSGFIGWTIMINCYLLFWYVFWLLCTSSSFRNSYEGHPLRSQSSVYTTFGNGGYDHYSTIDDIGDPNKNPYLASIYINNSQN